MSIPLRILFLVAEAAPFIKVGGLGDVGGSLPPALKESGNDALDIRLVIPYHPGITLNGRTVRRLLDLTVPLKRGHITATVHCLKYKGVIIYLIGGGPLDESLAVYMADPRLDGRKYTFFSLAALELARHLNWAPDVVHANDWHTAAAVTALKTKYKQDPFFSSTRAMLTIHNLPFMGDGSSYPEFGLPFDSSHSLPEWAHDKPLPLGLLHADHIVAVSPSYAQGILTKTFGCGLQDFLASRKSAISGILNGLDYKIWDPEHDPRIDHPYSTRNIKQRHANKLTLIESVGMQSRHATPLLGMVSRLDPQKGIDLAFESLYALKQANWQFILVGTGNPELENAARKIQTDFPDRVWVVLRYDETLAHQVYAGADMLLMPSRYEPCGLAQLIAQRYGCIPVATPVGGLQDTILDPPGGRGQTGFLADSVNAQAFTAAIQRAIDSYSDTPSWRSLQKRGMKKDFSWDKSAEKYIHLYKSLTGK